ncbi:polysaccharide biosynthesis protein [Oceanobacillus sp. FSL K6-0118]|uniref:putative polysaccharide biosynthesis protein n=1 Tax=Oceanobacillus sp. FSL K6-0118 TaxID=2921418 RepID=UPI0030F7AADA
MSRSTLIKGTIMLTVASLLSKILGSIFRIPLQNIAGDEVLGIFSLVYPVYMVALILSVAGIPTAISKLIAEERALDPNANIRPIYVTASILALSFGVVSFTFIYVFSSPIAYALGGPTSRLSLIIVATTLLIAPYMAVYRGFFQGFGDMGPTAISQVIEQFIRVGLILVLAYVLVSRGLSNEKVAGYIMIGSVAGALASFLFLRVKFARSPLKPVSNSSYSFATFSHVGKKILKVSIPIAIGSITMALVNFIDSLTIPFGLRSIGVDGASDIHYLYGIYGRGLALVQIATVFATSIVLPLIPLLTEKLVNHDRNGMRTTIEKAFYMANLIAWPAAFGLLALTLPMNVGLFSDLEGSTMLAIIGFSSVFTSLTVLGTGILQGMNLANQAAYIILIGIVVKTFSNIFLVHLFGLNGAAISTLVVYIFLFIVNMIFIYRNIPFSFWNGWKIAKMIVASLSMAIIIGAPTLFFQVAEWSRLQAVLYVMGAILVGAVIYFGMLFVWNVIDRENVKKHVQKGG